MKIRLLFVCLLVTLGALSASAQEPLKDQAKCFTTWDDNYLYIAAKVDSPDVQATHKKANQDLGDDDRVVVYVEPAGQRPEKVDATCFAMAVTPAAGSQFFAGNANGSFEPQTVYTFKYGVSVQGTLNNSDDVDTGYSIEIAIPWQLMKAPKPGTGTMLSFNVVIRRHDGSFVSISPKVKTEADILCPAKWSKLVFAPYSFAVATTDLEKIVSAKYVVRPPLINGTISDKEWHANTSFLVSLPSPAGVVYEAKFPIQKTVVAKYAFWFRPDNRMPDPAVTAVKLLREHPIKGAGFWSSSDRTQPHKEELMDAANAGVDVLLISYPGGASGDLGMVYLATALDELTRENRPHPQIGLQLSTSAPADQEKVYQAIKGFFTRVPVEYRATAQAAKPRQGKVGCVVSAQLTPEVEEYCCSRFEKEFGCPLVFTRPNDEKTRSAVVAPVLSLQEAAQAYSSSMVGLDGYKKGWESAMESKPGWVWCTGWNTDAYSICATREYGRSFIDATAAEAKRFRGGLDFDAQYVRCNVPNTIPGKQIATAEFQIKNVGNSAWRQSEGYAIGYRWYRGGRYYCDSRVRRPLGIDLQSGDTITVPIGIATVDMDNQPLAEGQYELRVEMIRLSDNKWFSSLGDQALMIPVTVGKVADWAAGWVDGHALPMMASGPTYRTIVKVRNEGAQTWPKTVSKLACKLYKVTGENSELVPIKEVSTVLGSNCSTGSIAEVSLDLSLVGADKKAIPAWKPGDPWHYELAFDIYNGKQWLSELGVSPLRQAVAIFEKDCSPRIVDCAALPSIKAGQTVDARVVLRNSGTINWDRKRVKLGYHWYHLDGTELQWEGVTTPLPANVLPGMPLVMTAKVTAPQYDGQYVLVWDLNVDGVWQSTQPLRRGGDVLAVPVQVTNGKLLFVDIRGACDIAATSALADPSTGAFNSKGDSFPAELFPPDVSATGDIYRIYPTGYNAAYKGQPEARISFAYPDKTPGTKNAVACSGQTVSVEPGKYRAVHILGASSDGVVSDTLVLNYADGDQNAPIKMNDWLSAPLEGEAVALQVPVLRTRAGDLSDKSCSLYDYAIPLDAAKTVKSITLPKNERMKIVAITLEK